MRATERYIVKRGEVFSDLVELFMYDADKLLKEDYDFTGISLDVDLRDPDTGKKYLSLTISEIENVPGHLVLQFGATGEQTALLPVKKLIGDLKFSSAEFGPYMPAGIEVDIKEANTR